MFKRVDERKDIKGFSYESKTGLTEGVLMDEGSVGFIYVDSGDEVTRVYYEDIPNFIKALQAAYDYKRSEKDGYK